MSDPKERTDIPMATAGQEARQRECDEKRLVDFEPTLRDRLEQKRNRLSRELVQVEEALRLVYADPNVERIHETLKRARV